jgi:broad specificity phosphatase PhoE
MSRLTLVRHGQASFLAEDYDKLSTLGKQQCRLLGAYWATHGAKPDRIFCGPRRRHCQSAEEAVAGYREAGGGGLPEVVHLPELDEFAWGPLLRHAREVLSKDCEHLAALCQAFEDAPGPGEKHRTLQHLVEAVTQRWIRAEFHDPAVEPWEDFLARVRGAVETMTAGSPSGTHVAVFTSGGTVSACMHHVLQLPSERTIELVWTLRNAALTEFLYSGGRFNLSCFNEAPHLPTPDLWTFR